MKFFFLHNTKIKYVLFTTLIIALLEIGVLTYFTRSHLKLKTLVTGNSK